MVPSNSSTTKDLEKAMQQALCLASRLASQDWPELPMGFSWYILSKYSFQMRSGGRTYGGGGQAGTSQGYSSSEDDEITRLKPAANSGTSTSGGSSSGARRTRPNYRNQSNSEGATSPADSDNTYAEASLLHNPRPVRYGKSSTPFIF